MVYECSPVKVFCRNEGGLISIRDCLVQLAPVAGKSSVRPKLDFKAAKVPSTVFLGGVLGTSPPNSISISAAIKSIFYC